MKNVNNNKDLNYRFISLLILIALFIALCTSCTTTSSSLVDKDAEFKKATLKRGEACEGSLFGGFSVPYIKETSIRVTGTTSITKALKNGDINKIAIVDDSFKSYFFYTRKCKTVYGF